MRQVLHAHRDGKYVALNNMAAIVVDYDAQMLRIGLDRWPISRPRLWRFLAFMLRSADLLQHYTAIAEAMGSARYTRVRCSHVAAEAEALLAELGMTLETVDDVGYRLHTEPRSTLACCKTLAPGQPLPSRVRSMRKGHGGPHMTPAPLPPVSIRRSRQLFAIR